MNTAPASVLVIENHPLMREALCTAILAEPDLKVTVQGVNGTEALEMMIAVKPDIILLALGNPGLDDLETLNALRRSLTDTSILALTSNEVDGQEQAAFDAGAHAVLTKSAPREELICALRNLRQINITKEERMDIP